MCGFLGFVNAKSRIYCDDSNLHLKWIIFNLCSTCLCLPFMWYSTYTVIFAIKPAIILISHVLGETLFIRLGIWKLCSNVVNSWEIVSNWLNWKTQVSTNLKSRKIAWWWLHKSTEIKDLLNYIPESFVWIRCVVLFDVLGYQLIAICKYWSCS